MGVQINCFHPVVCFQSQGTAQPSVRVKSPMEHHRRRQQLLLLHLSSRPGAASRKALLFGRWATSTQRNQTSPQNAVMAHGLRNLRLIAML